MAAPSDLVFGQLDFSGGVNSIKTTTIEGNNNPNGLAVNQLAWLNNGTVRDGGISPRGGWKFKGIIHDASGLYQRGFMYRPDNDLPYLVMAINGNIYRVIPDNATAVQNLSVTAFQQQSPFYVPPPPPAQSVLVQNLDLNLPFPNQGQFPLTYPAATPTGFPPAPYPLTGFPDLIGAFFIPNKGQTGTLSLVSRYPGSIGDIVKTTVSVRNTGGGNTTLNITLKVLDILPHIITEATGINPVPGGTSASQPLNYFEQAENFLVIQAGDYITLPLFWDGTVLFRSIGINNTAVAPGTPGVNQIPAAGPMDYYQDRLWYAQGRNYSAGDILGSNSGTKALQFRDSVLNVTENPLVVGGDGFTVPSEAGNIEALEHPANLDSTLGQGSLFIGTRKAIYSLNVPISRTDWIAANNNNRPRQSVVQLANGPVNDTSMIPVNGDLFYQSLEPGIRSLIIATRFFEQPGNRVISANENRILQFVDRSLLRFASGIEFDNRMLQTSLPRQTPQGVVHDALIPMDFIPVSSFEKAFNPIWEGMLEGLQILQLFVGDFNGVDRAFAVVVSRDDSSIQLWEITKSDRLDFNLNGESRINWQIEFPAYTWEQEFLLKKLVSAELWVDRVWGEVVFKMDYRPDGQTCWIPWHEWKICSARNSCEDPTNPICYPITPFGEGYRQTMTLPKPPEQCATESGRPSNIGYQFQCRLTITGYCRVRGLLLHAEPVERKLYSDTICSSGPAEMADASTAEQGEPFFNTEQSCSSTCQDGSTASFATAPGLFSAATQFGADEKAKAFACQQAGSNLICMGTINPIATRTIAYSSELQITGQGPFTVTLVSGALAGGLSLSPKPFPSNNVVISGTPTIEGTFTFTLKALNSAGASNTKQFTITVRPLLIHVCNDDQVGWCGTPNAPSIPAGTYCEDVSTQGLTDDQIQAAVTAAKKRQNSLAWQNQCLGITCPPATVRSSSPTIAKTEIFVQNIGDTVVDLTPLVWCDLSGGFCSPPFNSPATSIAPHTTIPWTGGFVAAPISWNLQWNGKIFLTGFTPLDFTDNVFLTFGCPNPYA